MNGFSFLWMEGFVKAWVLVWNQSWIFHGTTDADAQTPMLWPPDAKSWLIWKDPDAGKDWRREEKGAIEDEMVGWHHQLNGHEFERAPGVGDRQGGLACCSPWGRKESDTPERLNWSVKSVEFHHSQRFHCWDVLASAQQKPCIRGYMVALFITTRNPQVTQMSIHRKCRVNCVLFRMDVTQQ